MKQRRRWLKALIQTVLTLVLIPLVNLVICLLQKKPADLLLSPSPAIYTAIGVAAVLAFFISKAFLQPEQHEDDKDHKDKVEAWRRERSAFGAQKGESNARPH